MFARLGNFVSRRWLLVILGWAVALVGIRLVTPRWDDVTFDGDLAYLPDRMPSVQGERLLAQAFPDRRAKSQIGLAVARSQGTLQPEDLQVADELARVFHNYCGAAGIRRHRQLVQRATELEQQGAEGTARRVREQAHEELESTLASLDEALLLSDVLEEPFPEALHNRAIVHGLLEHPEKSMQDYREAVRLKPELRTLQGRPAPAGADDFPLLDVWTRHTEVVGEKLRSRDGQAQLVILQMSNEFMATDNIRVLDIVQSEVQRIRQRLGKRRLEGLAIGISGSAAVGGDMLTSAAESIRNTERYTILLVVVILIVVYRSPVLIAVPLATIGVSLVVATSLVAALTQLRVVPGMDWWNFKIFTTTRIFVVVIMFGAGTDFCLFLIARYREELENGLDQAMAIARALAKVSDALVASALTTIVGLSMMYFADFGKFRNSGPAIGLCLLVALLACLTLAPALLRALGRIVFWPFQTQSPAETETTPPRRWSLANRSHRTSILWSTLAHAIVRYPGRILIVSVFSLTPLAWFGGRLPPVQLTLRADPTIDADRPDAGEGSAPPSELSTWQFPPTSWYRLREGREYVSFDLLATLAASRPSRVGTEILKRHFPIGESGPLIILAKKEDGGFDGPVGQLAITNLTRHLYVDGVEAVRSIAEPLGDYPKPGRQSLLDVKKRAIRTSKLTRSAFLTQVPALEGDVARFELILKYDPFSAEANDVLRRVDQRLRRVSEDPNPVWDDSQFDWIGTQFVYAGTTAAIRDLRSVTRSDNKRIKILVIISVFFVLLLILRRPVVCIYMILSVLFTYYVTMGATELFFATVYGDEFAGLDWKVPLFLFVILVAIGQDYNVYLATRVFEEQELHGPREGLQRAIVRTGGIITSCGVIMAGTFVSMATGTLLGIVELGFALSLGVLLDTFIVRPILVPAFLAYLARHAPAEAPPTRRPNIAKTPRDAKSPSPVTTPP